MNISLIIGYQPEEEGNVKDLILGCYDEQYMLQCRGKVYLGISKEEKKAILDFSQKNKITKPLFEKYKDAIWIKPELVGTAHFMHETENGGMRQPVWKGLRE